MLNLSPEIEQALVQLEQESIAFRKKIADECQLYQLKLLEEQSDGVPYGPLKGPMHSSSPEVDKAIQRDQERNPNWSTD